MNADFTQANFENDLHERRNNVVHIATHFDSRPGMAANSHLLLGDGTALSLAQIESSTRLFNGVDLLTLSACNTAFTNRNEDGREVDSFGTIAQRLGAKAVVASLWSVNDQSTSMLMKTMYSLLQQDSKLPKSEGLRQAQASMATGVLKQDTMGEAGRGLEHQIPGNDWKHPFYWAPFILIGNWN